VFCGKDNDFSLILRGFLYYTTELDRKTAYFMPFGVPKRLFKRLLRDEPESQTAWDNALGDLE
jgi:hypothetical protein